MPWAESPYNTEPFLEKIEMEGKQGNKVLLEGVKTGSAKVTVRYIIIHFGSRLDELYLKVKINVK